MIQNLARRDLAQLTWLNFVQPAAVNAPLTPQLVTRHLCEQAMHVIGAIRMVPKHRCQLAYGVEHQVKVCRDRGGSISNEPEGLLLTCTSPHVRAKKRGGLAPFLPVPRNTFADQVSVLDSAELGSAYRSLPDPDATRRRAR